MLQRNNNILRRLAALLACCLLLVSFSAWAEGTLRVGDRGDEVLRAQQRLKELGYYDGEPNGLYDEAMTLAVQEFQYSNDLLGSGYLDEITKRVLYSDEAMPYVGIEFCETEDAMPIFSREMTMEMSSAVAFEGDVVMNTNEYGYFEENGFCSVASSPFSTFAADVDNASYTQLRSLILGGQPVPEDVVRVEEMLNYFHYSYTPPTGDEPLGVTMQMAPCPWNEKTRFLLIGLQAKEIETEQKPPQNLVFLIDVSGSMDEPDKLPLVKRAFSLLLETLEPTDTVSLVTYASSDAVVLDGVPAADRVRILEAIDTLTAGGATAGAAGIRTAYELAEKHFLPEGNNRILLATDGDLNVGVSDEGSLVRLVEEKKQNGVMISVLGFGYGNYKDNKLEALADYGDGNYHYIDTIYEARRTLVTEAGANFFAVAKDVKLQCEFNPDRVKGYRLIGYENRTMNAEDFADDSKDGGELGSGHRMTVLYELVPSDSDFDFGEVSSKYQSTMTTGSDEWLTLNIRCKEIDEGKSSLYTYPLTEEAFTDSPDDNLRFAAAVAETGMLLRGSEWSGSASWDSVLELLRGCESVTGDPLKEEFLYMATLLQRAQD